MQWRSSFGPPKSVPNKQSPSEFDLIERFFVGLDEGPAVALGNGDDAALLSLDSGESLAVSVDAMHEGVHFPQDSPADQLSYRAIAAAASDLAAMGARPLGMTIALSLPEVDESWLRGFRAGVSDARKNLSLPLVGGDLVRGTLSVTVQVMGAVAATQALTRSGAAVGDRVYVSGSLGDAAAGLAVIRGELDSDVRSELTARFWRPQPELQLGQVIRDTASSAIDVSDGLLADAGHIAKASGVRIVIESKKLPLSSALLQSVPREQAISWALSGGEDFRLCFTQADDAPAPAGCVDIGYVAEGAGVCCDIDASKQGFRHF